MSRLVRIARPAGPALAVVAALTLAGCTGGSRGPEQDTGAAAPAAKTEQHKNILYWKSSMDPTFVSKHPGKDPMGMDLVPVYQGQQAAAPPGTVRIDPATVQNIGVTTMVVRSRPLSREIRTVGRIAYDERKVRRISPKISGWVEHQYVNYPGQVVERGERLLEIYSPELVSTQEEYLLALQYHDRLKDSSLADATAGSESLVQSAETRLRYWDISPAQIKALRDRRQITRTMVLHAPFKGIVLDKNVLEGGFVQSGQNLYTLADISTVWVYADIYEYEAAWLKPGQPAEMRLAYRPGVTYRGRVTYVYPYLKEKTRTLQVRMEFRNSRNFDLKPDMWADVTLRPALVRRGLAVPVQAVFRTGTRNVVLIALGGGHFAPRELKLGAQVGDDFEVLNGLSEGDRVVTSAQFLIDSESNLRAALAKMLEPGPASEAAAGGAPAEMPAMGGKAGQGKPAQPGHSHGD